MAFFLVAANAGAVIKKTPESTCERLMNVAMPYVEMSLQKNGELVPFGVTMNWRGYLAFVAGYDGKEAPPSSEVIQVIKAEFKRGVDSGEYVATALLSEVRVSVIEDGEEVDAIAVSLDHKDNYSVIVYFPYQLDGNEPQFGESIDKPGEHEVFGR